MIDSFLVILVAKRSMVFLLLSCFMQNAFAYDEFVSIIADAKQAVVTIDVTSKKKWFKSSSQKKRDKLLHKYETLFDEGAPQKAPKKSTGSGFLISRDGSILTAAHVVRGASNITVRFTDGKSFKAELVRYDRYTDIALLKLNKFDNESSLRTLQLNETMPLEGQSVLAIGAAFGLSVSSTLGIVSAINVSLSKRKSIPLIQTDAAINPGSSGGVLLDKEGRVIGMISKIYSQTGTFSGSAFAIPASLIKEFLASSNQ